MFTIEQINELHDRLGNAETLLLYAQGLQAIGIDYFDSYLFDGHSEFFGTDGTVKSPVAHEILSIAETTNKQGLLEHLSLHEQRKINYLEMSRGLAESGVEKWTVDTHRFTMTFYDCAGNAMLVETIK
jgi:uncharacterized protein YbcV (DUF1398 family)